MRDQDRQNFTALLNGILVEIYQRAPLSAEALSVWFNTLKAYDFAAVREALARHMTSPEGGQFAPKPADVIRHLDGSSQARAQQAWAKVMHAVGRVGQYQSVVFDDPVIHRVIADMGGWPALCCTDAEKELPFRAREFEQRYAGYLLRALGAYPRCLPGLAEVHNSAHNHKVAQPILIGDTEAAKRVLAAGSNTPNIVVATLPLDEYVAAIPLEHKEAAA